MSFGLVCGQALSYSDAHYTVFYLAELLNLLPRISAKFTSLLLGLEFFDALFIE